MTTRLATEVGRRQEEIWSPKAKVIQQHEEVRMLRADMEGEPLVSLVVLILGIHGWPFDAVGV